MGSSPLYLFKDVKTAMHLKEIKASIEKITDKLDLYLIDLAYRKDHGQYLLEVFIDSKGGLTMDQCEEATRAINLYLDEEDPIKNEYTLIVSSPGLDRPLVNDLDFFLAKDFDLEINLYEPIMGQKKKYGKLYDYDDESIYIINEKDQREIIDRKNISKANKAVRI